MLHDDPTTMWVTETRSFPVFFPMDSSTTSRHPSGKIAARFPLRLCDRRSWDHQLTFTPPRLAMLLSLSVGFSVGFSPSVEWLAKVWESNEKSMGRLYPLISYDKFWPSHLCMNIINNKKWLARDTDADTQIFNHIHYTSQAQRRRFHTCLETFGSPHPWVPWLIFSLW